MSLSMRSPVRPNSFSGHHPPRTEDFLAKHENREPGWSSHRSHMPSAFSPMLADLRSPFLLPDPLTLDSSRACAMLTDDHMRPATAPEIVVNVCGVVDNNVPFLPNVVDENLPLENHSAALENSSTHFSDRRRSGDSTPPSNALQREGTCEGSACTMYVPYRPWYEPINKTDSGVNLHSVHELSDGQHEADSTRTRFTTAASRFVADEPERPNPEVPIRSPPPPPLPMIVRSRRKPPVPPRRRADRVADPTPSADRNSPTKRTSHTPASLIPPICAHEEERSTSGTSKLPYLDELKHVLAGEFVLRRRASTGKPRLGLGTSLPISSAVKQVLRTRSLETLAAPQPYRIKIRRSRSASAPELTTPSPRAPVSPHISELLAEPTVLEIKSNHTHQTGTSRTDNIRQVTESVDQSLVLTRMKHICDSWNQRNWLKAETYLTHHLNMINGDHETARRIRFLLGVYASYQSHWQRALMCFIGVLNKPIRELQQLNCGDKAAFYWLGDTYSLMNRKEEALLAYCLAGSCNQSITASDVPSSRRRLLYNQGRLRQHVSKASFKAIWADPSFRSGHAPKDGILHYTVVAQLVAQTCLQSVKLTGNWCSYHGASKNSLVQGHNDWSVSDMLLIIPAHLVSSYPWPMPYDPTFNFHGVDQGSLAGSQCDIMSELQESPEMLYFARWFSPNLSGPSCIDLHRLIVAIRESLQTLAMQWYEVVSLKGVFFLAQYHSVESNIATINYFRIEVIRLPLRNGNGLNFCSDSTGSARVSSTDPKAKGGLNAATKKELKRCLRAAVETSCARQRKGASPSPSCAAPPLPPRPLLPSLRSPKDSTESSTSPAELETPHSTPHSSVDLSTLVPPTIVTASKPVSSDLELPSRARARISVRSSYNERHLPGPLVR